ncbi:MAG TPA: HAD-IB family hydrolase [Gemmataceae bacterium]|jgi:phosphatidylglycerophosphatase C
MTTATQPLAVFDLDGTLTARDTFLPFLVTYARRRRHVRPLAVLPVYLGLYACRVLSDRAAKERVLVSFLSGRGKSDVADHADWFARTWVPPRLRPAVVDRLREHQRAGHRVVLLSASPDVYVPAIARELGITEVVCTPVACDDATWHGRLAGPNCKGAAKLARLREYLGCDRWAGESYAYGDRPHDLDVLRWAGAGYLVTRRAGLVRV